MKRDKNLMLKILRSVENREGENDVAQVAVKGGYTAEQNRLPREVARRRWPLGGRGHGGGIAKGDTAAITLGVLPTRVTTFWKMPRTRTSDNW